MSQQRRKRQGKLRRKIQKLSSELMRLSRQGVDIDQLPPKFVQRMRNEHLAFATLEAVIDL